jgi:hypothetical protein
MASCDTLDYDASYYDFLKRIQNLGPRCYAARVLEWEDYVGERAREVLSLALRHRNETHVFTFATMRGCEVHASVTVSRQVSASVWQGGCLIFECNNWHAVTAREGMAGAIVHHRLDRARLAQLTEAHRKGL